MHRLNQAVARELAVQRIERARGRSTSSESRHPPSRPRQRAAATVARLAERLDSEAARLALK